MISLTDFSFQPRYCSFNMITSQQVSGFLKKAKVLTWRCCSGEDHLSGICERPYIHSPGLRRRKNSEWILTLPLFKGLLHNYLYQIYKRTVKQNGKNFFAPTKTINKMGVSTMLQLVMPKIRLAGKFKHFADWSSMPRTRR